MRVKNSSIALLLIFSLLVSIAMVSAVRGPYSYNGKEYYAVDGQNPGEDSGTEICAKVGKSCVGFTAYSTDVCKQANPSASVSSGMDGSKTGFYCNGAPQVGVCSRTSNSCLICPACNVNADCDTQIGDQYREMYVECSGSGSACPEKTYSKTTRAFVEGVPSLDEQIQKCSISIKGGADWLVSNGIVEINVAMRDGTTLAFYSTIKDSVVTGMKKDSLIGNYIVDTDEVSVDTLLQAENKFGTFATLYGDGKIKLRGGTFWVKFKLFFIKPIIKRVMNRNRITLVAPTSEPQIGPYTDQYACEFYQLPWPGVNKKHATCPYETPGAAINQAADVFCQTAMGSLKARATICEQSGLIVCVHPCPTTVTELMPQRCAFDNDRKRGNQAAPLSWCTPVAQPSPNPGTGRPSNCFDTAYQAHDGYNQNKALWDQYRSETDGVCQAQNSEMPKGGNCKHVVQLGKGLAPYYICFYKN